MMFNPDSDPEVCRRAFGKKGEALEAALASASRILPLVTNAHSESAACDLYWPEIYWNFPMAAPAPDTFWDTPSPKLFQNVTALDPQQFSSCSEYAGELLGERHLRRPRRAEQLQDVAADVAQKMLWIGGGHGGGDDLAVAVHRDGAGGQLLHACAGAKKSF